MIVTITSLAPNRALSAPGTAPTTPPPTPAATTQNGTASNAGRSGRQQQSGHRRGESARRQLALGADVEQSGAQAERDGETR